MDAVVLSLVVVLIASASSQPDGLLTEDRLAEEAIFIGDIKNNLIHQALFPDIRFVCPGNLTRWTVVVSGRVLGGTRYPEVHVWRPNGGSTTRFTRFKRDKLSVDSPSPVSRVYEAVRDPPLEFGAGDVFGVYNPTIPVVNLLYQKQGGFRNHYIGGPIVAPNEFNLDSGLVLEGRNDYPLVSVDVTPPECAVGFIGRETLLRKASLLTVNSSDLEYREGVQRIIPALLFPTGGVILNVTLGALRRLSGSRYPEVQLWRSTDGGREWFKVAFMDNSNAEISNLAALNVHRYTPFHPVPVQAGDIVGLYQPYTGSSVLRVFMRGEGPVNFYTGGLSQPLNNMAASGQSETRLPLLTFHFSATSSIIPEHTVSPDFTGSPLTMATTPPPASNRLSSIGVSPDSTSPGGSPLTMATTPPPASNLTGVIVGGLVVVGVLLSVLIAVGVALLVYRLGKGVWRKNNWRVRDRTVHQGYDTTVHVGSARATTKAAATDNNASGTYGELESMEYNEIYPHSEPAHGKWVYCHVDPLPNIPQFLRSGCQWSERSCAANAESSL